MLINKMIDPLDQLLFRFVSWCGRFKVWVFACALKLSMDFFLRLLYYLSAFMVLCLVIEIGLFPISQNSPITRNIALLIGMVILLDTLLFLWVKNKTDWKSYGKTIEIPIKILMKFGSLKNDESVVLSSDLRFYNLMYLKNQRLMGMGFSIRKKTAPLIQTLFNREIAEYRESHREAKEREKWEILNGIIPYREHSEMVLTEEYGVSIFLWESPDIPIIQNLRNARYLHHDDPDIMRALEMIKLERTGKYADV